MRRFIAMLASSSLILTGCASVGRTPVTATTIQPSAVDRRAMADYVQRLPAGSRVKIERSDGTTLRGTLMQATEAAIVVQKNTRIPEPPIEVAVADLARVTTDSNGGIGAGKAVAIGIASGVGAFFAILAIAFAASGD